MIRRLKIVVPVPADLPVPADRPVRLLAVSDEVERALDFELNRTALGRIDGVLGCGDLEPGYLAFLADAFHAPLLYVRGNHDRGLNWSAGRKEMPQPIGRGIDRLSGLPVVGLSWPGDSRGQAVRDEGAAWRQAFGLWLRLRGARPLIMLSHVPPRGLGDVPEDDYHRGFAAYRWLCHRLRPRLWLHGHTAPAATRDWRVQWADTTLVNVTGAVLVEIGTDDRATANIGA